MKQLEVMMNDRNDEYDVYIYSMYVVTICIFYMFRLWGFHRCIICLVHVY